MQYEIYSIDKNGYRTCHVMCKAAEVDIKLLQLQEKYPQLKIWIFGIDVHFIQND